MHMTMRPRRRSIRTHLACLVAACVLPVWLAGGYLLHHFYQGWVAQSERHMQESARAIRMVVDRELASMQSALEALATSPALLSGDMATFHRQTLEVLKRFPESDIILADKAGQQFVNSFRPFGTALPKRNTDGVNRVFATGKPCVANLFRGAVTGRPLIGVDVPVIIDGRVAYDLAMTAPADRISSILLQQKLPPEWVGVIFDSKRIVVARTKNPKESVGQNLPQSNFRRLSQSEDGMEGSSEGVNLEGIPIRVGFSQSEMSNWTFVVNTPTTVLMAGLWQWMWWFSAAATIMLLVGGGVAFIVGRGIVRDMKKLSDGARRAAGGDLSHRIAIEGVRELAEHARIFNEMMAALQASYEKLERNNQELEQSNRELEDFTHVASHDLQEPLRKIQAFGSRLRLESGDGLNETGVDCLIRMEKAAERMQALINAILDYSLLSKKKQIFQQVDLGVVAREVAEDLETQLREGGGEIDIEELPTVAANSIQMRQLLQNLIGNGLKYHRPGVPPKVRVAGRRVSAPDARGMCEIIVSDNGIGFDERLVDKIFTPFQRLHDRTAYEGTGIGLAIVKKIVERHGGTIVAKSQPSQGSTFIIALPCRMSGADQGTVAGPRASGRPATAKTE